MTKNINTILFLIVCILFFSCSNNVLKVYHYDASKIDDGDIGADNLKVFFVKNERNKNCNIRSRSLTTELSIIKNKISLVTTQEIDDGFYDYAIVTTSKDTFYTDYRWKYWRHKEKGVAYTSSSLELIFLDIKKQFDVMLLQKN